MHYMKWHYHTQDREHTHTQDREYNHTLTPKGNLEKISLPTLIFWTEDVRWNTQQQDWGEDVNSKQTDPRKQLSSRVFMLMSNYYYLKSLAGIVF